MPRRACAKDTNQDDIADAYRKLGWDVIDAHEFAQYCPGFPDLVCSKHGQTLFVEVKTAKGKLTDDERRFHVEHPDMRIVIDRSVDDILERCGI